MDDIIKELKTRFPWLGTDRTADGGNTVEELADWYDQMLIRQKRVDGIARCPIDSEDLMRMFRTNFENGQTPFLDWWEKHRDEYKLIKGSILPRNCPKCNEVINKIFMFEPREAKRWPLTVINGNDVTIDWTDTTVDAIEGEQSDFECPECNAVLFHDIEDASKWLLNPYDKTVKPLDQPDKFYNVLRVHREDISTAWKEESDEYAMAALELEDKDMMEIAENIGGALLDGGDYHMALTICSEDLVSEAYEKHKEEIDKKVEEESNED